MEPCALRANASVVIASSSILAYLFLPFHGGTKPPFVEVFMRFLCALVVVVVSTLVFD